MSIVLNLNQILSSGSASLSNRWSFCSFLDKAIFAHGSVRPQYWPGFGMARDLPGLPSNTRWNGVIAFQGHLMGWQGATLKWSDVNDFTNFIPVPSTVQDIALTLVNGFTQLAPGVESDWIFFNESTAGMVPEMFIRLDYPPYYNFYTVNAVSLVNGTKGTSAPFDQSVLPGASTIIYTVSAYPVTWASATTSPSVIGDVTADTIGFAEVKGSNQPLKIVGQSPSNSLTQNLTTGFTAPAIGASITLAMLSDSVFAVGDYASLGGDGTNAATSLCRDIYQVTATTPTTASDAPTITIKRLGLGNKQQFSYPANTYAVTQPYVTLENDGVALAAIPPNSSLVEAYALKLTLEDLTGIAPEGSTFIGDSQFLSLNANEAGELVNAGDRINGPIWNMSTSGLYAVIMKERSFQSIQYVGLPGIFNIWPEFTDEGLLGRNTWCKVGENTIYFWGHRAFFEFASGSGDPTPIGQKHFVQVLKEMDLSKISEACMYHKEDRREVWFVYPVQGINPDSAPSRVFVYNYEQGSISIDDYAQVAGRELENTDPRITESDDLRILETDGAQSPVTAVGSLPVYTTALEWQNWEGEWQDQLIAWSELTGGRQFLTLMALFPQGEVQLASHGNVYSRNGEPYYSAWQTMAFDGGDEAAYKYTDLLRFSLAIDKWQQVRPFRLYAQVGVQENLDGTIMWSTPQWVDCSGNANYQTKLNFKLAGRYISARWFSFQAECEWRIASFELSGRLGGTY